MARPEVDRAASHPLYSIFRLIKQQNTFAFYTSRAGMIETLDYRGNSFNVDVPAAAITLQSIGRSVPLGECTCNRSMTR